MKICWTKSAGQGTANLKLPSLIFLDNLDNVKEEAYSDKPTDNYHQTLQLPATLLTLFNIFWLLLVLVLSPATSLF